VEHPARLPGRSRGLHEGSDIDASAFLPSVGALRAVMICVDFPDAPAAEAPEGYQDLRPYHDWLIPGSRDWFRQASYGRLDLQVEPPTRWLRMHGSHRDYGFARGIDFETHARYIEEAVGLVAGAIDFSAHPLVFIVPARNAEGIRFSPTFIDRRGGRVNVGGRAIRHAVTFGHDAWRWGFKVVNHETLHTLGLPDLYAFAPPGDPPNPHPYVGGWDLMGLIAGHAPDLFAWHKWKLGWLEDAQVDAVTGAGTTRHRLSPVALPGGTKMAVVPTGETTALVVESRRPVGVDAGARDQGALVYTVDSAVRTGYGPLRVVVPTPERTDPDAACLGLGDGRSAAYADPGRGLRVEVLAQDGGGDVVEITRASWGGSWTTGGGMSERDPDRAAVGP